MCLDSRFQVILQAGQLVLLLLLLLHCYCHSYYTTLTTQYRLLRLRLCFLLGTVATMTKVTTLQAVQLHS